VSRSRPPTLARIVEVARKTNHFVAVHAGIDEQHAGPSMHDNGVALCELTPVNQYTLRDLSQHWTYATCVTTQFSRFRSVMDESRSSTPLKNEL